MMGMLIYDHTIRSWGVRWMKQLLLHGASLRINNLNVKLCTLELLHGLFLRPLLQKPSPPLHDIHHPIHSPHTLQLISIAH